MVVLEGDGTIWSLCSLNCLVNDVFGIICMVIQSKWENFTSRAPIPMESLDPHLSCSHIRGNDRFIWLLILVPYIDYYIP